MKTYETRLCENEKKAVASFSNQAKSELGKNILYMKLFGSKVRGNVNDESDIDILMVVRQRDAGTREEISRIASELNIEFDCLLSPVIHTEEEYNKNRHVKSLFAENIENEGITL